MAETIKLDRNGEVCIVTIDRPSRINAIDPATRDALREQLETLIESDPCRAIVLTGAGKNFSSGGDVTTFAVGSLLEARAQQSKAVRTVSLLAYGPKPVMAAVEGYCFGMAMGYAMASDYVVASKSAKFCVRAPKIGLTAQEHGLVFSVPRRVGWAKARSILMLAPVIDGEEAARIGLADELAEEGQALAAAVTKAKEFAALAPTSFALTKTALAQGFDEALKMEVDHQAGVLLTADFREGAQAFAQKRPPRFVGK